MDLDEIPDEFPPDDLELEATDLLRKFFDEHREEVFFSRQLEVIHEDVYFHWITNRAIRLLEAEGVIRSEWQKLRTGTSIKVVWYRGQRFQKRIVRKLIALVEEYADPNIAASLGLHGEIMVLEGFARSQFVLRSRDANEYLDKAWTETNHNLDFIFERDGIAYGVEVKNTLGYMNKDEFELKIRLCHSLGIRPVFVCRMLPKSWIYQLQKVGGFALILKYQLYPWTHKELAKRVSQELSLPVDAPRALAEGTMMRFLKWHIKQV